jgi:hypothetical protein
VKQSFLGGAEHIYANQVGPGQSALNNAFNREQFITSLVNGGGDKVRTTRNRINILGQSTQSHLTRNTETTTTITGKSNMSQRFK